MIFKLLAAPISTPMAGFRFVLEQLRDMAERELYDEEGIRQELLLLQLQLEEGELGESEYAEREAEIIERLRAAREYRQALAARQREAADD